MTVIAVVGLQWGDEGKGKTVDDLAGGADVVVRAQGGDNAGHTVVVGGEIFKLHLLPSGVVREGLDCVIGNGVVANPCTLKKEVDELRERGMDVLPRLHISDRAHMLLPYHRVLDGLREDRSGAAAIGTTRRGIGPCYADKANRVGLRWHHARDPKTFEKILREHVEAVNRRIRAIGGDEMDADAIVAEVTPAVDFLRPRIADTVAYLHNALEANQSLLLEGAQGAMLDLDFGTYPYLTSSNTTAGGLATGTGIPPGEIREVHGILKAFTTRVGEGPFPTELEGDEAGRLRGTGENQWDEYGTTTGRPRRCGWLDLVVARYACRLNGVTRLHITKLDILGGFEQLKVCTAYDCDDERLVDLPACLDHLANCAPVYETLPGWSESLDECRTLDDLPAAARRYVEFVSDFLKAPVASVGFGPGREQTVHCK